MEKLKAQLRDWIAGWQKLNRRDKQIYSGLGLIALLILVMFAVPSSDQKISAAADRVMVLAENVRSAYRNKPNYWGLNTQTAIKEGVVPANMLNKGLVINGIGSEVLIGQGENGDAAMPGTSGFDIIYKYINKKACILLLSYHFSDQQKLGLRSITLVNSKNTEFSWGAENPLPVEIHQARQLCEAQNTIIWSFE